MTGNLFLKRSLGECTVSYSVCVTATNANGVTEKANMSLFVQIAVK